MVMQLCRGIDISEFQGYPGHNPPDWATAKPHVDFVVARVAYGTRQDQAIATNWPALKQAGIPRGSYQFALMGQYAEDPAADAQTHVAAFLSILNQYGGLQAGDFMPAMDIETNDRGYTTQQMVAWIEAWGRDMQAALGPTTRPPMIYTYLDFLTQYPFWHQLKIPVDLWVADYSAQAPTNLPWVFWQYSDKGTIPGITGPVDLNQWRKPVSDPPPASPKAPDLTVTVTVAGYHPDSITLKAL